MKNCLKYITFAFAVLLVQHMSAQTKKSPPNKNNLIQFSGVVVEGDSLRPVPYASIMIKDSYRGTVSDYFGYFSFVAQKGDTIEFSAIGYRDGAYVIPDTLSTNKYSLIQVLSTDTVFLKTTEVYAWPSKEQFKHAFLQLNIQDDELARAQKNMDRADMKERMTGMANDATMNYKYSQQQYQSKLYYAGQLPPNNLLNPIAWSKFIKAWKNGDFKTKKKK
jgi:hypothetical protein